MSQMFTEAENIAWHNANPAKRLGTLAIIERPDGRSLVVKTTYRPGYQLVGGVIEVGESPLTGVVRETREELSLKITPERFKFIGIHYYPENGARLDAIHILFKLELTEDEVDQINLQSSELVASEWHKPSELSGLLIHPSVIFGYQLLQSGAGYSEGRPDPATIAHIKGAV